MSSGALTLLDFYGKNADAVSAVKNGAEFSQRGDTTKLIAALGDAMKVSGSYLDIFSRLRGQVFHSIIPVFGMSFIQSSPTQRSGTQSS